MCGGEHSSPEDDHGNLSLFSNKLGFEPRGGRANKKQMLLGGIMLFIKPISSLTQLSQL